MCVWMKSMGRPRLLLLSPGQSHKFANSIIESTWASLPSRQAFDITLPFHTPLTVMVKIEHFCYSKTL